MSEFPERAEFSDFSDEQLIAEIAAMTLEVQSMRSIGLEAEAKIIQCEIEPRTEELVGRSLRRNGGQYKHAVRH